MKLVVLYGPSVANDFVVGSLAFHHPALVVREEQPAVSAVQRVWRRHRDPLLARLDKLAFFALYGVWLRRGVERGLRERLGPHPPPPPGLRVGDVNQAIERVRAVAPTLVLVLGASILRPTWHALGVPIVNVHVGIAPRYRGRFCWFWPILEGRPDDVGVTLHLVTDRVDSGPIVLQRRVGRATLGEGSFADVLGAVTLLARELCTELLADPEGHLRAASPPPDAEVAARRAYLEPGLTSYLRFARSTGPWS